MNLLDNPVTGSVDISAFSAGCKSVLEKKAYPGQGLVSGALNIANPAMGALMGAFNAVKPAISAAGNAAHYGMSKLLPETTRDFIDPALSGVKKYNANPDGGNWSLDGMASAAGKGIEGQRSSGLVNKAQEYGVNLNTDQYGVVNRGDPVDLKNIDWMKGLKQIGSQAMNYGGQAVDWLKNDGMQWAKDNPWKLAGGAAAGLGVGYLLKKLFGGSAPQQSVMYNQERFMPQYAPSTMAKYGGMPNGLFTQSLGLPYSVAANLINSRGPERPVENAIPLPPKPNIYSDDPKLQKLLANPQMRAYVESLVAGQ